MPGVIGDTSGFDHPEFTEADLPAIRSQLAAALQKLEAALAVANGSSNSNAVGIRPKIQGLRNSTLTLIQSLTGRF